MSSRAGGHVIVISVQSAGSRVSAVRVGVGDEWRVARFGRAMQPSPATRQ